jgi:hypothetical protein
MKARYDLYLRKLKGDHTAEKLLQIQQQIADFDPNTFWGVGATGYIGMYRRTPSPFLSYGWDGAYQLKQGTNTWLIGDSWIQLDHAGHYQLALAWQKGASTFKVKRVAVRAGKREICSAKPPPGQDEVGPGNRSLQIPFHLASFVPGEKHLLVIECEATDSKVESLGSLAIEPILIEEDSPTP